MGNVGSKRFERNVLVSAAFLKQTDKLDKDFND